MVLSKVLTFVHHVSGCSLNSTLAAPQSPAESKFFSPYYPYGFPINITCGWLITAPENHIIELKLLHEFKYFKYLSEFTDNGVEVYDVEGSERSLISLSHSTASDKIDVMYSKSHSLYVLFKSDNKPEEWSWGFSVPYTAIATGRPIKVLHVF